MLKTLAENLVELGRTRFSARESYMGAESGRVGRNTTGWGRAVTGFSAPRGGKHRLPLPGGERREPGEGNAVLRAKRSAPGENRTHDTGFRRAVLYPLSYRGITIHQSTMFIPESRYYLLNSVSPVVDATAGGETGTSDARCSPLPRTARLSTAISNDPATGHPAPRELS